MAGSSNGFHWADWVLFVLILLLSLGVGIFTAFTGGKQKTTSEVLMGSRQLHVVPVTMSIFMSFISAIMVLGNTAEVYLYGIQSWASIISSVMAFFFVAHMFVPIFYNLGITSSFEYLERRYRTRHARIMGDVLMIVSQCLYMGVVTFAPATAMEAATGFPFEASIVLSIVVATFYTSIGGMKAVVWTDALQGTIYLVGIIVILVEGISAVGGLDKVWEINQNGGRLDAWVFDPNIFEYRMTFWGILIGGFISAVNAMGATQTSIQRYCALPSLNKAKLSVILLTPFQIVMISLSFLIGMVVYAYFEITGCDPLRSGVIGNANQLLPHFIMEVVNIPGIPGLFFAVLYCGSLSSLSSSLSALSAVTWTDMLESRFSHLPEERKAFLTKTLASGYGLVAIAIAFAVEGMGVHVAQASSSLVMSATGPLLGMFVCGFFLPWVNGKGAVGGAIFGLAMMIWTSMGANITAPYINHLPTIETNCTVNTTLAPIPDNKDAFFLYKLSYLWYDAMGMTLTVLAAIIITFFTGPFKPSSVDPRLVIPIFDRLVCCLPESVQKKLWCGVKHDQVEDFIQEEIKKDVELKNTTNGSTSIRGHKVAPLPPQIFRDSKVDILAPDFTQQRVISHIPESLP